MRLKCKSIKFIPKFSKNPEKSINEKKNNNNNKNQLELNTEIFMEHIIKMYKPNGAFCTDL